MNSDRIVEVALAKLTDETRGQLAAQPADALRNLGLHVRPVHTLANSRNGGGACDGMSFLIDGVVLYAPTPQSKRENFTLAHELGHWLIDQDEALLDVIADHQDPPKYLEQLCDRIAQKLLLPDDSLATGPERLRAQDVLDLHDRTQASHPVCAIALAQRISGLGAIAIIDADTRLVTTASVHPHPDLGWPTVFPWPGHEIPAGHPLVALAPQDGLTRKSFWRTPWGNQQDFYIDAVRRGRRIVAVFADSDIWGGERLHLDAPRNYDTRPTQQITCCGQTRTALGYPCTTCGEIECPKCHRCRCDRLSARDETCTKCWNVYRGHLVVDGACVQCRGD